MLVANISEIYQTRTLTWSFHVKSLKFLVFVVDSLCKVLYNSYATHMAQTENKKYRQKIQIHMLNIQKI